MDFEASRRNMVESQIRTNRVTDQALLGALLRVPRERFVPKAVRALAYIDEDLRLAPERFLMEPMVLARLIQAAGVKSTDVVLDVGCATGYATALLADLAATVVGLESDAALAGEAVKVLQDLDVDNALIVEGDLRQGYPRQAPYDVILINGAVAEVPETIADQLADGGRLVTVVGNLRQTGRVGRATLLTRVARTISSRSLFDAAIPLLPSFAKEPSFVF
jgi:protein-L-isoaspartate(D-aspartate) O-methyltransferase